MAIFTKGRLEQLEAIERVVKKHTILIVDDEEANLVAMSSVLQDTYNLLVAHGGREALDLVKRMDHPQSISLVLSDQRMPQVTGVMLFQELAELIPKTIRIIVTGFIDVEAIIDSVNKAHIYQFILKPFERSELLKTIEQALETFEQQKQRDEYIKNLEQRAVENAQQLAEKNSELERAYQSIEAINMVDQLTKFNSRSFLLEHLEADLEECVKRHFEWNHGDQSKALSNADMGFFMVNLDQIETIYQTQGNAVGDHVMMNLKGIILTVFKESDYLIRWNGQDLLIVARFINRSDATELAERLRQAFEQHQFVVADQPAFNKTCSVGFACYPFESLRPQVISWMQLVEMATVCLKAAKQTQPNAWIGVSNNSEMDINHLFFGFTEQPRKQVAQQTVTIQTSIAATVPLQW